MGTMNEQEVQINHRNERCLPLNNEDNDNRSESRKIDTGTYQYVATGAVANQRLKPLLPSDWIDITATTGKNSDDNFSDEQQRQKGRIIPDFLWENSPRHETKQIRDDVLVYSHLPNGINILDSKWVLGRIFSDDDEKNTPKNPLLATCETHCFTSLEGFREFARSVNLLSGPNDDTETQQGRSSRQELQDILCNLPDISKSSQLLSSMTGTIERPPIDVLNWWVVKDAGANGAGGVWVVGSENAMSFGDASTSPIISSHKYVAQQYVWPPVLYEGKKCHVRVYVTVTCDGSAFVHKRAFLHIANDPFTIGNTDGDEYDESSSSSGNRSAASPRSVQAFDDCIHITNCCANSHDDTKFAGEILADFGETDYTTWSDTTNKNQQPVVPLADFLPSVQATVSEVVRKTFRLGLLNGGRKNNGFEYCGMDFMLSYKSKGEDGVQPIAYLLEINSPPSQDTASSLPHAEDLHNEVLRDWMTFWVIPHIDSSYEVRPGGWLDCEVNHENSKSSIAARSGHRNSKNRIGDEQENSDLVLPSKAAILNKFRWALFERKMQKKKSLTVNGNTDSRAQVDTDKEKGTQQKICERTNDDNLCKDGSNYPSINEISSFVRSQFPFFSTLPYSIGDNGNVRGCRLYSDDVKQPECQQIFFENAGGAQVPQAVIDHVTSSLARRHREVIGAESKVAARRTLRHLLVGGNDKNGKIPSSVVILGLNTTSLLESLAKRYVKLLSSGDEIVISTENHLANFEPWIDAAKVTGTKIKLWAPFFDKQRSEEYDDLRQSHHYEISSNLDDLVTPLTRIVALPHASNVLGSVYRIKEMCKMIKDRSRGYAHTIVDGVAVAPHKYVGFDENFGGAVDWYVVSMHKLFGPHMGVLLARQNQCIDELLEAAETSLSSNKTKAERVQSLLESGTANIEGTAGIVGLGMYFRSLSKLCRKKEPTPEDCTISTREAILAYSIIQRVEMGLVNALLRTLSRCPQVRILNGSKLSSSSDTFVYKDELCLPTVSFLHKSIPSSDIYTHCRKRGIICRNGFFLCTKYLANDLNFKDYPDGAVRISLAHYNTKEEVEILCNTLERIPKWFSKI